MTAREHLVSHSYLGLLRLNDARKAENLAARQRAQGNRELCAHLLAEAQRRGHLAIDWPEYFRNAWMAD